MSKYFGTDGIRGKAGVELDALTAFKIGRYLGYYYSREGKKNIVVGKDTRLSSDMLEHALASGIASQGCDAYLTGGCPTPMIAHLTVTGDFVAGAMVSASHNPFYDNGIKIFNKQGIKLPSDTEELIESYIDGEVELEFNSDNEIGKVIDYPEGKEIYLSWLEKQFPLDLSDMNIIVDCANGSSTFTAQVLLTRLHANLTVMNSEPDGLNINTKCGSTHPEGIQEAITKGKYDIGLTFDGDADRMILVNPKGELVTGDHVLYMCGRFFKDQGILKDDTVVTTVMANLGLFKALGKDGISLVSTQVGDKYVYDEMCKHDYIVGGEQSGHIIFKDKETTGDGLVTALEIISIMKKTGKSLEELCQGLKIFPQLLVNVKVKDKNEAMNDEEVKQAIEQVNKNLDGNGRLLVRPSGTEPLVRVMAEAETDEICAQEVDKIASIVKAKFGI